MLSDRDYTKARFRSAPPRVNDTVLKPLIIVNIVVYILQQVSDSTGTLSEGLTPVIMLDFGSLMKGEVWRLGTYMFAHGSFWHILLNMWGLWLFGGMIEQRIGGRKLLNLYLLSGFIGGVTWLLFNHSPLGQMPMLVNGKFVLQNVYPSTLGASGSVFGFLLAGALLEPNRRIMLLFPPIPMELKTFAIFYGVMEAMNTINQGNTSRVAHLAHLGGMLGGYIYMRWAFRGRWMNVSRSGPRFLERPGPEEAAVESV